MKKGLVIVHDPHNLFQFVWYYCNRGKNQVWDALCLPNGNKGEYMHLYCERADIFENIIKDDTYYSDLSLLNKFSTFFKMFIYFVFGNRTNMCKNLLSRLIDLDEYSTIVVISDTGIITGACVALGKEKEIIILEDGINDYGNRPKWLSRGQYFSLYSWQGLLLSKMGYSSPGWFRLKSDFDCVKYCSQPKKMQYKGYKEIRRLYDMNNTDYGLFDSIIKKMYPEITKIDFNLIDAVLFTHPTKDYVKETEKYNKKIESYISSNFKSVLIKKHPRDTENYTFRGVKIQELDSTIPAEAMLPYLNKSTSVIFSSITAIMISLSQYNLRAIILDDNELREESFRSNTDFSYHSKESIINYCDNFLMGNYEIQDI